MCDLGEAESYAKNQPGRFGSSPEVLQLKAMRWKGECGTITVIESAHDQQYIVIADGNTTTDGVETITWDEFRKRFPSLSVPESFFLLTTDATVVPASQHVYDMGFRDALEGLGPSSTSNSYLLGHKEGRKQRSLLKLQDR